MAEEILNKIIDFTDRAHGDQMRKYAPDRYIVHPVRVMKICSEVSNDVSILAAALLHDVLEDTKTGKKEIRDFLLPLMKTGEVDRTLQFVDDLTNIYTKKNFPHLNRRARKEKELNRLVKTAPESQTIKYADIIDNTPEIVVEDPEFAVVFLKENRQILGKLDKGNTTLRDWALQVVYEGLEQLR